MDRRSFLALSGSLPALLEAQTGEPGFTPLFDGKTLTGWHVEDGPQSAFYVDDGAIVVNRSFGHPAWLRSEGEYENFDFRGEFFLKGWMDSGIYFHAPRHGRPGWNGLQIHLFHQNDEKPMPQSVGAVFPLIAPRKTNVRNQGQWNSFRIHMDWPRLQAWINDELVQDLDIAAVPELAHRFRAGHLGFQSLSYPIRFRNLRVKALAGKEVWQTLYGAPEDFAKWQLSDGKAEILVAGDVLHADGNGLLATKEKFRDFELQLFVRHARHHNGGIIFRGAIPGTKIRPYEIQLHDVEGAHYPTGSLYFFKRALYPKIEPEVWFPVQLYVKDRYCRVRVNGDDVLEYDQLENLEEGPLQLQAHQPGTWTEFKQIRIKRI